MTNNGTPSVLFCFIILYLMFSAGPWSLDALMARRVAGER